MSDSAARVTPMLCVANAAEAITFYIEAFGAIEVTRIPEPDGRIMHAELTINGAPVMLADEYPEIGVLGPKTIGGSPVLLLLEVPDVDTAFAHALATGATLNRPISGTTLRNGKLVDPFGHHWMILTRQQE